MSCVYQENVDFPHVQKAIAIQVGDLALFIVLSISVVETAAERHGHFGSISVYVDILSV